MTLTRKGPPVTVRETDTTVSAFRKLVDEVNKKNDLAADSPSQKKHPRASIEYPSRFHCHTHARFSRSQISDNNARESALPLW